MSVRKPIGVQRAKRAYLAVEKHDKYGKRYVGQNEIVLSHGMYSAAEADRELQRAADESAEPVVDARVETYGPREVAEMDGNPNVGGQSQTQWGGFQGVPWLQESPLLRERASRREQAREGAESGT